MIELVNRNVTLRELNFDDWVAIQTGYAADPIVTEFMDWGPNTDEKTKQFLRATIELNQERPRTSFDFAIIVADELIGTCGLRISGLPYQIRTAELGYVIAHAQWGKGYTQEAAHILLRLAFEQLDLHRVYAMCDLLNARSERVLQKLGMRKEGHFLQDRLVKERWRDTCYYAILKAEWLEKHTCVSQIGA